MVEGDKFSITAIACVSLLLVYHLSVSAAVLLPCLSSVIVLRMNVEEVGTLCAKRGIFLFYFLFVISFETVWVVLVDHLIHRRLFCV